MHVEGQHLEVEDVVSLIVVLSLEPLIDCLLIQEEVLVAKGKRSRNPSTRQMERLGDEVDVSSVLQHE